MILGNPYEFAVIYEKVNDWNIDDAFDNGVLLICLNGFLFPSCEIINTTLKHAKLELKRNLQCVPQSNILFETEEAEDLFKKMYEMRFPDNDNAEEIFDYQIAPTALTDKDYYIFAVTNGVMVRLLAAKLNYCPDLSRHLLDERINIVETYQSIDEIEEIARLL